MRFMVTGGAGFIGSHFVRLLIAKGHEVVVYDNLSTGKISNLPDSSQITFIQGNIQDPIKVEKAMEGCDYVIHLAALVSVTLSVQNPKESKANNLDGLFTVLEAARKKGTIKKFVLASSAAVYGDPKQIPISENQQADPISPYGLEKYIGELYLHLYNKLYNIPTLALRFFNVYGERQDPKSPYSGVISIFTDRRKQHLPITVFGDGEQTRDFIYVGQLVSTIYNLAISAEEGNYNLGTGVSTSINTLIQTLDDLLLTKGVPIEYKPARLGDIRTSVADISKLRGSISVEHITLSEGLEKMLKGLYQATEVNHRINIQFICSYFSLLSKPILNCIGLNMLFVSYWFWINSQEKRKPTGNLVPSLLIPLLLITTGYSCKEPTKTKEDPKNNNPS